MRSARPNIVGREQGFFCVDFSILRPCNLYLSTKNKDTVTHLFWKYLNHKKPKAFVTQNAHPFYASFPTAHHSLRRTTTGFDKCISGLVVFVTFFQKSKGKISLGLNTPLPKHLMLVWDWSIHIHFSVHVFMSLQLKCIWIFAEAGPKIKGL